MKSKCLISLLLFAAGVSQIILKMPAQSKENTPARKVQDSLRPIQPGCIRIKGFLGKKIDTCIQNRIRAQNIAELIEPFQKRPEVKLWRCEFWGKWFTSATAAYQYTQDTQIKTIIDKAVTGLMATQSPDGYIGTYKDNAHLQGWDVWGRKYTLLGLLAYHDITSDPKSLSAAIRHADFLLSEVGPGKADIVKLGVWNGMAASSILEPVMLLYGKTGQKRYLEFGQYIVDQWSTAGGPALIEKTLENIPVYQMFSGSGDISKEPNYPNEYFAYGQSKAYEMMSCFEGLAELYRFNGNQRYMQTLKMLYENIRENEITIIGSGSDWERWFGGRYRQTQNVREWMETCVTVTWMKFCYQLLRLTGEPKFADEIELTAYNALAGSMKDDGTWWSHYNPLQGIRGPAPKQCYMNQNCCVANGPRGMLLLPKAAVMSDADGPVVNLYFEGSAELSTPAGTNLALIMKTDYPQSDTITITVQPEKPESFSISLRIPAWSKQTSIKINGQPWSGEPVAGTYLKIKRKWKKADTIELKLDFRGRLYVAPNNENYTAIMRGPVVLAADKRLSWIKPEQKLTFQKDQAGYIPLQKVPLEKNMNIWMAFSTSCLDEKTGKIINLVLCDYASAGNTWSEDSRFRLWF